MDGRCLLFPYGAMGVVDFTPVCVYRISRNAPSTRYLKKTLTAGSLAYIKTLFSKNKG